jgi:hypothetical protein
MMDPLGKKGLAWTYEDLKGIMEHSLNTSLDLLIQQNTDTLDQGEHVRKKPGSETVENILTTANPDLSALRGIKEFSKGAINKETDQFPSEVAQVLYVLTIIRARLSGIKGFSKIEDDELLHLVRMCLAQTWVPDRVRDMLRLYSGNK